MSENNVTVDNLAEDEELVAIVIYNHTRDKLCFKAVEGVGHEALMALLKKAFPDAKLVVRNEE